MPKYLQKCLITQECPHILPNPLVSNRELDGTISGGDMASTWVAKPSVHVEHTDYLLKLAVKVIVANDDNYALAA